jgi:hypothetical protein
MIKPPARWLFWTGLVLVALLAVVTAGMALVLPLYLESRLIPDLAAAVNLVPDKVQIRRVGWWGADLGPIQFSRDNEPVISVAAVQVDYSPQALLRGEVAGITLVGLDLGVQIRPDGLTIAGQDITASPGEPSGGGGGVRLDTLLPITLQRLSIVRSHLRLDWHAQRYQVAVDLSLQTGRLPAGILEGQLKFSLLGNPFVLAGRIDQSANQARVSLKTDRLALDTLAHLLPRDLPLEVVGTADLNARLSMALSPFQLADLFVTARCSDASLLAPDLRLQTLAAGPGGDRPLVLTLAGQGLDDLRWGGAPFRIVAPFDLVADKLAGRLSIAAQGWSLSGTLATRLPKQTLPVGIELAGALPLSWELDASQISEPQASSAPIRFEVKGRTNAPVKMALEDGNLATGPQAIAVSGHYQNGLLVVDGRAGGADLRLASPEAQVQAAEVAVAATARIHLPGSGPASTLSVDAGLTDFRGTAGRGKLQVPSIDFELNGRAGPQAPWDFTGALKLAHGRLEDTTSGIEAGDLAVELPLAWPASTTPEAGWLDLAAIRWKGREMGGLKGILRQESRGLTINLRHVSKQIPGMDLLVKGRLAPADTQIEVRIPPHEIETEVDLGRIIPAAAGFRGRGRMSAVADLRVDKAGPSGSGRFKVSRGRVHQEARNLTLEGIDLAVHLADLFALRSAPQQRLKIERLVLGDLVADHLNVDFQLEALQTLFIEKAGLNWCQGRVNAAALRIHSGKPDYRLTFYCDRLNLAQLLKQLGAAEASGSGSVNGRVPISWVNRRLSFDNGFLYSTPGQSGTIRLTGTQALLAGLPPGSPQHTQLDIATEALKDYSYQWAKLHLQSEGDILLLKLQLDGRPNRLLPFVYDQALGQFKRISGAGQAEFKGISIDLNFRSPLNEIIHYKELFNTR